ncbi:hypothetical protein MRX96_031844 [Rhipicephalus microplus]
MVCRSRFLRLSDGLSGPNMMVWLSNAPYASQCMRLKVVQHPAILVLVYGCGENIVEIVTAHRRYSLAKPLSALLSSLFRFLEVAAVIGGMLEGCADESTPIVAK